MSILSAKSAVPCLIAAAALLSGCENMSARQQRMLSGGAIGAGAGAVGGYLIGAPVLGAAVVGGAAGTAVGAFMEPAKK